MRSEESLNYILHGHNRLVVYKRLKMKKANEK